MFSGAIKSDDHREQSLIVSHSSFSQVQSGSKILSPISQAGFNYCINYYVPLFKCTMMRSQD